MLSYNERAAAGTIQLLDKYRKKISEGFRGEVVYMLGLIVYGKPSVEMNRNRQFLQGEMSDEERKLVLFIKDRFAPVFDGIRIKKEDGELKTPAEKDLGRFAGMYNTQYIMPPGISEQALVTHYYVQSSCLPEEEMKHISRLSKLMKAKEQLD